MNERLSERIMEEAKEKLDSEMVSRRKEKRKALKKMKRKERRKEIAEMERLEEEARLNDPEEQKKRMLLEQQEAERIERDRIAFEEREKAWIIKQQQQAQIQLQLLQQQHDDNTDNDDVLGEEEEDEEDGPPEIIWLGNEIIIKKKKPNLLLLNHPEHHHDNNRPTSNPFPPESPSQPRPNSALPDYVAQQIPNFGTELDKAHCPFHLKTGVCRFGDRCSRVHFYPDKSCTFVIKNMYNGPGLAWEQDEGLEYTDEEIQRCFEEFYEDVHTEFLKFGEIVNFKVCRNGSFHLRGNVYVQYKSLDSALLAYNSINGRYFAGKQVRCEFVNLTRWKVAICGEYKKSRYETCSRGTACNFIHCFRNPGGDYEWADSDRPPPKFWVKEMVALFGHSDDDEISRIHDKSSELKHSCNVSENSDRHHSRKSKSKEINQFNGGRSDRRKHEDERKQRTHAEEWNTDFKGNHKRNRRNRTPDIDSDMEWLEEVDREKYHEHRRKSSFNLNKDDSSRRHEEYSEVDRATVNRDHEKRHDRKGRSSRMSDWDSRDCIYEAGSDEDSDRRTHHSSQRKGSRHRSRDNNNVTDEPDKNRGHEEYFDVDWDTMTRNNEKKYGGKGMNSPKPNKGSRRHQVYEAGSDEDRHRKRHRSSQKKESRHISMDNNCVIDESDRYRRHGNTS
ncbi:zinc finger CCCH domain-containing protein 5 isoform X2 [Lathyrus oleraceus]|nr:zinc finger CCCH domain-containing protein 5 isoform X2 [Pisum sativum]